MDKFYMWISNNCGNEKNCIYPKKTCIKDIEMLKQCIAYDHTFISFKDNYRREENFISADVIVADCDNGHSDNPNEWIYPNDIALTFFNVKHICYTSRSHMKTKAGKSARPRFHTIFFVDEIKRPEEYKKMLEKLQNYYPFFDSKALDAARFFYGNPNAEVEFYDGNLSLSEFFANEDAFLNMGDEILEGSRNATMFKWAVCSLKRYGNTDETKKSFYKQAEKCVPPLDDSELKSIFKSAERYYKKIANSPGYISPKEYNNPLGSEPIPLSRYTVADFPIDALPDDIKAYVLAVAESTQTPIDMAGASAISVLSVCLQGKYRIKGKNDWIEPLNTYLLTIAPPSERKSAVQNAMLKPINTYENKYNRINAPTVETSKMKKRILERRQKAIEEQVAKGKADLKSLDDIAREITDFTEIKPLRLYVDDITTEKLISVLSDNKGRAAIISSEGGIFDTLSGIYTKNVNIDVMLKGYSGDPIKVDRIGRESESITNPTLTIQLMAQPNVVEDVLHNKSFRGRGLTARFLYCMPDSFVGKRRFNSDTISDEIYRHYEMLIINLLEDECTDMIITLSKEATRHLTEFAEEIEPKLIDEYAEIADWAGKLIGNTLRIAGLLCRANRYIGHDFIDYEEHWMVDEKTMLNAIQLGKYFLNHAQAVYSVLPENEMTIKANKILKMLKEKGLKNFDRREAMRSCRMFKTVAEIQPVLDFLEDYGYIFLSQNEIQMGGRPHLPKYTVSPYVHNVTLS